MIYEFGFGAKLVRGGNIKFEIYARLILSTIFDALIDDERSCRHGKIFLHQSVQNNRTAHTAKNLIKS
jgi:hypothetical protein